MELLLPEWTMIAWFSLSVITLVLMLIALYSILTSKFQSSRKQLTYTIGVVLLPIIGAVIYLKNRKKIWQEL